MEREYESSIFEEKAKDGSGKQSETMSTNKDWRDVLNDEEFWIILRDIFARLFIVFSGFGVLAYAYYMDEINERGLAYIEMQKINSDPYYAKGVEDIKTIWSYTVSIEANAGYCEGTQAGSCVPPGDVLTLETKHGVKIGEIEKRHEEVLRRNDLVIGIAKMLDRLDTFPNSIKEVVLKRVIFECIKKHPSGLRIPNYNLNTLDFEIHVGGFSYRLFRRVKPLLEVGNKHRWRDIGSDHALITFISFSNKETDTKSFKRPWYLTEFGFSKEIPSTFPYSDGDVARIIRNVFGGINKLASLEKCNVYLAKHVEYHCIPNMEKNMIVGAKLAYYVDEVHAVDSDINTCIRNRYKEVITDLNKFLLNTPIGNPSQRRFRSEYGNKEEIVTRASDNMVNLYYTIKKIFDDESISVEDAVKMSFEHPVLSEKWSWFNKLSNDGLYVELPLLQ